MTLIQPGKLNKTYTGITLDTDSDLGSTITTVNGHRFIYNGSQFCILEQSSSSAYSEMNVWNNDGTSAFNFIIEKPYMLDMCYDATDDVYYGIRWNNDENYMGVTQSFGVLDDEGGLESAQVLLKTTFSGTSYYWETEDRADTEYYFTLDYYPDSSFDSWFNYDYSYMDGSEHVYLERTSSIDLFQIENNELKYTSTISIGYYSLNLDINGEFVAYMDINATSFSGTDSVLALRCLRQGVDSTLPYNHLASVCLRGPTGGTENVQGWVINYPSASAGNRWYLSNLRINERYLDDDNSSKVVGITNGSSKIFDISVGAVSEDSYWTGYVYQPSDCYGHVHTDLLYKYYPASYYVIYSGDVLLIHDGTEYGYGYLESESELIFYANGLYEDHEVSYCLDPLTPEEVSQGITQETIAKASWPGLNSTFFPFTGGTSSNPEWSGKIMSFDLRAGYILSDDGNYGFDYTNYFDDSAEYTSRSIDVYMTKEALDIDTDKIRLAIKRIGTTLYLMKRDSSIAGGVYTTICSKETNYSGPVQFELYADGVGSTANDVSINKVVVRGLFESEGGGDPVYTLSNSPVFTIETYDKDGKLIEVPGISDSSGHVIRSLDVIQDNILLGGAFENFPGRVQIATDHSIYGGELYINYENYLYKYLKSSFPLVVIETGSNASIITEGEISSLTYENNTLNFNGYTLAGLVYLDRNLADLSEGLYVNCIRNETMTKNSPLKSVWIEDSDSQLFLYAVDPNTTNLLYGFSYTDRKVYIYDLDEYKAAFTNVVFEEQILGANTGDSCVVKAQVVNVYGDPLEGKSVQFSVSSGDGSVSPASDTTDSLGEATTEYTVGSTVGLTRITAIVTN